GWVSRGETTLLPPVQLVYRAEDAARFQTFGSPASLNTILEDPTLVLGVSERMSYGEGVDQAVAAHRDQPNVFLRSGRDVGLGLHEMLIKRRIDYTVNYPWAATFTAGPEHAGLLGFLPFTGRGWWTTSARSTPSATANSPTAPCAPSFSGSPAAARSTPSRSVSSSSAVRWGT
ncbi:hypothetical protein, partial [Endothiovibrio diazotrophicus]